MLQYLHTVFTSEEFIQVYSVRIIASHTLSLIRTNFTSYENEIVLWIFYLSQNFYWKNISVRISISGTLRCTRAWSSSGRSASAHGTRIRRDNGPQSHSVLVCDCSGGVRCRGRRIRKCHRDSGYRYIVDKTVKGSRRWQMQDSDKFPPRHFAWRRN